MAIVLCIVLKKKTKFFRQKSKKTPVNTPKSTFLKKISGCKMAIFQQLKAV